MFFLELHLEITKSVVLFRQRSDGRVNSLSMYSLDLLVEGFDLDEVALFDLLHLLLVDLLQGLLHQLDTLIHAGHSLQFGSNIVLSFSRHTLQHTVLSRGFEEPFCRLVCLSLPSRVPECEWGVRGNQQSYSFGRTLFGMRILWLFTRQTSC